MKQKNTNCKYCNKPMDAKTTRKVFCSVKCKVYWHRDNEPKKDAPKEEKVKLEEEKKQLSEEKKDLSEVKKFPKSNPKDDPKENSMAFFMKYGVMTYAESEKLKNKKE